MTIFDFIPQLQQVAQSSDDRAATTPAKDLKETFVKDFLTQQAREYQEWEQLCQRAWMEMERDIQASDASCSTD